MDAVSTVRDYYDSLRGGEPLAPYFLDGETTVKFGVGERLTGYDEVAAGLREQTATTTDWTVESTRLLVEERGDHGWFSDDVRMAWTDTDAEVRHAFDTRWSGVLTLVEGDWRFGTMHVSAAVDTEGDG
ncbi:nuclear transport factor 2 family protein [Halorarius halobius]|uniref:nuclear transport factor 2 family protein n=1 Tax=Halorarius halobius TaxID=2962671 RepID=UPI0020CD0C0E|nr:nuclear transport factor 2 family protein [Halorarius halobius]